MLFYKVYLKQMNMGKKLLMLCLFVFFIEVNTLHSWLITFYLLALYNRLTQGVSLSLSLAAIQEDLCLRG